LIDQFLVLRVLAVFSAGSGDEWSGRRGTTFVAAVDFASLVVLP